MPNGRLGDLVLDTVVSEAHAFFELLRNTNTQFLEACQSRRPRGSERLETKRQHHCMIKP